MMSRQLPIMTDILSTQARSQRMALVRGKNTGPELKVRKMIYAAGYRYRIHVKGLPGRPDLVFAGRRKVIFVHGCFWHRHEGCSLARIPKSHVEFWSEKLEGNKARDLRNLQELKEMGWSTLTIWECELNNMDALMKRVYLFLG